MAVNMWKNSLKNVEYDKNKILQETLIDCFLQRNGTYFLNKPRKYKKKVVTYETYINTEELHFHTCSNVFNVM